MHNVSPPSRVPVGAAPPPSEPVVWNVPGNDFQVLDLQQGSGTPESMLRAALLSPDACAAVAAVGMGGSGKTTILRALGADREVWRRFPDGIAYLELGEDADHSSIMQQVNSWLPDACEPKSADRFAKLATQKSTERDACLELVRTLRRKKFLLILDDVWENTAYGFVKLLVIEVMRHAREQHGTASFRVLFSTRFVDIADVQLRAYVVHVQPRGANDGVAKSILCCYAGADPQGIDSMAADNLNAFHQILGKCAGLPLSLSVAGSAVLGIRRDIEDEEEKDDAWGEFWRNVTLGAQDVTQTGTLLHKDGLFKSIGACLRLLNTSWKASGTVKPEGAMESFCIMRRQMRLPLRVASLMWEVSYEEADVLVKHLARGNLVSRSVKTRSAVIRVHDLVLDYCTFVAKTAGSTSHWHSRLVRGYAQKVRKEPCPDRGELSIPRFWDFEPEKEPYMEAHLVRHMVAADNLNIALRLTLDYRWIMRLNQSLNEYPFQQSLQDLDMLKGALGEKIEGLQDDKDEVLRQKVDCMSLELNSVKATMERSIHRCAEDPSAFPFQLHARLSGIPGDGSLTRLVQHSIEKFAEVPWLRAGPGALRTLDSELKREFSLDCKVVSLACGPERDELTVGGLDGLLLIKDRKSGLTKISLEGHNEETVIGLEVDVVSKRIISADYNCIFVWHFGQRLHTFKPFEQDRSSYYNLECLAYASKTGLVVCGGSEGGLAVFDSRNGEQTAEWKGHKTKVSAVATSADGNVILSGSTDFSAVLWRFKERAGIWEKERVLFQGIDIGNNYFSSRGVVTVALSENGSRALGARFFEPGMFWDLEETPNNDKGEPFILAGNAVEQLVFSRNENFAYCCHEVGFGEIKQLQFGEGKPQGSRVIGRSRYYKFCLSEDEEELFAVNYDSGNLDVFRIDSNDNERGHRGLICDVSSFGVSPSGDTVVVVKAIHDGQVAHQESTSNKNNVTELVLSPAADSDMFWDTYLLSFKSLLITLGLHNGSGDRSTDEDGIHSDEGSGSGIHTVKSDINESRDDERREVEGSTDVRNGGEESKAATREDEPYVEASRHGLTESPSSDSNRNTGETSQESLSPGNLWEKLQEALLASGSTGEDLSFQAHVFRGVSREQAKMTLELSCVETFTSYRLPFRPERAGVSDDGKLLAFSTEGNFRDIHLFSSDGTELCCTGWLDLLAAYWKAVPEANLAADDQPDIRIVGLHFGANGCEHYISLLHCYRHADGHANIAATWNTENGKLIDARRIYAREDEPESVEESWYSSFTPSDQLEHVFVHSPFANPESDVYLYHRRSAQKVATLDVAPRHVTYAPQTKRLWLLLPDEYLTYLDLVKESILDSQPPRPIPLLHFEHRSDPPDTKIQVFISHAGPDKHTIAFPLRNALEDMGIKCFLDRPNLKAGDDSAKEMRDAMEVAAVVVVILSPEFAARRWPIRELRRFMERKREAENCGRIEPIVIPVFYRLSISECRNLNPDNYTNPDGSNLFHKEGFFKTSRQQEASTEFVQELMADVSRFTGNRNEMKASNATDRHGPIRTLLSLIPGIRLEGGEHTRCRRELVDELVRDVRNALTKLT